MGERTLDRLPPLFFFVDDGGGEARSRLDLLAAAEEEDAPGRLGIENGEGAGPSAGALLLLLVAAVLAARNFMVPALSLGRKMAMIEKIKRKNGGTERQSSESSRMHKQGSSRAVRTIPERLTDISQPFRI